MDREELLKLEKEELLDILLAIIKQQAEKIAELEARLNQNSKNSSKPPSSDGYKKQKSLRKPTGKKAGGQPGHEGSGYNMSSAPDEYIDHNPEKCESCPKASECEAKKTIRETRYEVDINIKTITTAHQTIIVKCPQTAEVLSGHFPQHINSTIQYGTNIEALAVALNTTGMVGVNRTHEILSGVFGVSISTGTISSMISDCANKVSDSVSEIKMAISKQPLINADETGTRVDKQIVWAHVASTEKLTYIDIQQNRGKNGMDAAGILLTYLGTVIHDCWVSYFLYTAIRHGLCNAHLLRELVSVIENAGQTWAQTLIDLLLEMKRIKEHFLSQNQREPTPYLLKKYSTAYDKIIAEALALNPIPLPDSTKKGRTKRGKVGSLVDRLILHKDKYLLFFTDFSVPFDNNQSERDIRMFKVKQKVSGCFRTMDGAKDFALISSYVGTARKNGVPAFLAIKNALIGEPFSVLNLLND